MGAGPPRGAHMGAQSGKVTAGAGLAGWSGGVAGAGGSAWLRATARRVLLSLAAMLARERAERRLALWLPIFFLAGVLAYFGAEREPGFAAPIAALALTAALGLAARRAGWSKSAGALCAAAFFFAGFSACVLRSWSAAAPVVSGVKVARVTAFVETLDERLANARLLLRVVAIEGVAPEETPARLRVTLRDGRGVRAGDTIRATMRLIPPAEPAEPGGYDFAREAFFQRIGAVGSILSRVERAEPAQVSAMAHVNAAIDRARNDLTRRIAGVIGGDDGAVAAALVTGKRGLISEDANEALRGAGIYHVVTWGTMGLQGSWD